MPGKIDWSFNVIVDGGPKFSDARSVTVDAYDKVDAKVGKKSSVTVKVQPSEDAGKVQFVLIMSTKYDDKLTFKVDGGANNIKLDEPQLLVGDGAVSLLNKDKSPKEFAFTNDLDADVVVQILVGRMT